MDLHPRKPNRSTDGRMPSATPASDKLRKPIHPNAANYARPSSKLRRQLPALFVTPTAQNPRVLHAQVGPLPPRTNLNQFLTRNLRTNCQKIARAKFGSADVLRKTPGESCARYGNSRENQRKAPLD